MWWPLRMRPRLNPEQLADIIEMRRKAAADIAATVRQQAIVQYLRIRADELGMLKMESAQTAFIAAADEIEEGRHLPKR